MSGRFSWMWLGGVTIGTVTPFVIFATFCGAFWLGQDLALIARSL